MKKERFWAVHILFGLLIILIAVGPLRTISQPVGLMAANPGGSSMASAHPGMFAAFAVLLELLFLWRIHKGSDPRAAADIGAILFGVLLLWELIATTFGLGHPILCPPPEAVFNVFRSHGALMFRGIGSSLQLLGIGFAVALPLSVVAGAFAGWNRRIHGITVPIARVMAPVPAIIYAPYIIAVMPTFRSAAAMVIILGIFWPAFLQTVNRVRAMDQSIKDSASMLGLNSREMVFQILLPWLLPGVVASLRVTMSTSFMLLVLAEMMGATCGLGYFIKNFADYANYTNVLAGIILVGMVVNVLGLIPSWLERCVIRWK